MNGAPAALSSFDRPHHPACREAIAEAARLAARVNQAMSAERIEDMRQHLRVAESINSQIAIALDKSKQELGL